jgi:hypothetical protein
MGKYDPLRDYLAGRLVDEVKMSFADIEKLVGPLPASARACPARSTSDELARPASSTARCRSSRSASRPGSASGGYWSSSRAVAPAVPESGRPRVPGHETPAHHVPAALAGGVGSPANAIAMR